MTREDIVAFIEEAGCEDEGILLADGFEDAFIGIGWQFNTPRATYDRQKCIDVLMTRDGMSEEDAEDYFSFNVIGAWVGDKTPIFLHRMTVEAPA